MVTDNKSEGLNGDKLIQIERLSSSENFVRKTQYVQ